MSAKAYSLKKQLTNGDIILGDYHDLPQFMLSDKLIKLPDPALASYAHRMLSLCLDNGISVIYVLDNKETDQLTEARQLFAEYDIQINADEI
ncbi:MAG TPA: hypothetical protein VIQ77_15245 [Mucilaginibacter sp.]|jgi:hypothetical protein